MAEQVSRGRRRRHRPDPGDAPGLRRGGHVGPGLDAVQRRLPGAHRGTGELPQRVSDAPVGHPGRHHRPAGRPQTPPGHLLPGVPAPAETSGRTGPGGRDLPGLRVRGLDPQGRRPGAGPRHRGDEQVRGFPPGRRARPDRGRVPGTSPRLGSLSLRVDRRRSPSGCGRAVGW